jgi:hypothetical protein
MKVENQCYSIGAFFNNLSADRIPIFGGLFRKGDGIIFPGRLTKKRGRITPVPSPLATATIL